MFRIVQAAAFLALFLSAEFASATPPICEPQERPSDSTFVIKTKSGTILGTAFPIDPRGIFLTAKHLTYQQNIDDLVIESLDQIFSFKISKTLASGTYNRADTSKLNVFDDWTIFAVDVDFYEAPVFSFPYDHSHIVDFSTLSAHSHLGSSSITSTMGRPNISVNSCNSESVIVAALNGYQKTSSGAPISNNQCAYGVTSRFDASYRGFLSAFSSNLADLEKLNLLSIRIYERLKDGEMKVNFIDSLLSEIGNTDLEKCIQESEVQCISKHVDALRDTLSRLEFVVITPISCISDSVLDIYLNQQDGDFRNSLSLLGKGQNVNRLLNYEIRSNKDAAAFSRFIQSDANIKTWSWISYLELVDKYLQIASKDLNTKPIERAIHNIGMEIGGVFYKDRIVKLFYAKRDENYRSQIFELRQREARLKQITIEQQRIVASKRLQLDRAIRDRPPSITPSNDVKYAERELRTAERRLSQVQGNANLLRDRLSSSEEEFASYSAQKSVVISSMASFETESLDGLDFSERLAHYEASLEKALTPPPFVNHFTFTPEPFEWKYFPFDENIIAEDHRLPPIPTDPQPFDLMRPDKIIFFPNDMSAPFDDGIFPLADPYAPFQFPNQGVAIP